MPSSRRAFLQQSIVAPMGAAGLAAASGRAAGRVGSQPAPAGRAAGGVRKPKRLRPGQTVGVVDPASATWDPVDVDIVVESLAALGLKAKLGAHLLDRRGYLAGRDEDRAADVMAMFTDPDVAAVHALRGGWGCARVLPHLDFEAIARNPKILLGYSDITALLLPVSARGGLVTFHGMNGASEWNRFNVDWFRRVLMQGEAVTMTNPLAAGDQLVPTENRVRTITPGRARGRLVGGNLTVLTTIIGSGLLPDFGDAILFVEDVQEAPYRIDRMFMQMKLAGILDQVKGVIFGRCTKCTPGEGSYGSLTISDILDDYLKPLNVPAWEGAQIGHIDRQFIVPIGVQAEVDADRGSIRLLEPAVS
jgi:muramoyltetrapeptide carboxypeptidase